MELSRRAAAGPARGAVRERAAAVRPAHAPAALPARRRARRSSGPRPRRGARSRPTRAGVNAWLAARGGDLPPEFALLRHRPEPWAPVDTLAFVQMMARNLSPIDDPPENDYFGFLRAFGAERARELAGDPDADALRRGRRRSPAHDSGRAPGGRRPSRGLRARQQQLGGGARRAAPTATRWSPTIRTSDLGLPNVWYQVAIRAPDYQASGMSFPGTPTVTIGRGPDVAWAFTNLYVDDVDVFVEELDPSGTQVRRGDGWETIAVEPETIRVKDGESGRRSRRKTTDRGVFLDADAGAGAAGAQRRLDRLRAGRPVRRDPGAGALPLGRRGAGGDRALGLPRPEPGRRRPRRPPALDADRPGARALRLGRPLPGARLAGGGRLGGAPCRPAQNPVLARSRPRA